jgi:crotonobetainyl-CoA:carnitine CoA-transferase CaiB-like acyl-CoA transferase
MTRASGKRGSLEHGWNGPATAPEAGLLAGLRVVDLCDDRNLLCGKLLADLGATVLKVGVATPAEAGSDFAGRRLRATRSAYNAGKTEVALDLADPDDIMRIRDLVGDADFLIESGAPGSLAAYGLDYETLHALHPGLVYVSVTPFGQTGPYSGFVASDIVLQGMGAHMAVTGEADRAPLSIGIEIAYRHGGAEAAAAAMIAHHYRERTGRGQQVDVSIQQCVVWTLLNSTMTPQLLGRDDERGGAVRKERGRDLLARVVWPCKDGVVHFAPIGGGGGKARSRSYGKFVGWMEEEGFSDPRLHARDWNGKDLHSVTQEDYDGLVEVISRFMVTKTVAELYERSVSDRILLAPISRIPDLLDSPQFEARGAFDVVEIDGSSVQVPARFAVLSETPMRAAAPPVSSPAEALTTPVRARPRTQASAESRVAGEKPSVFSGLKVVDFTWAAAGPIITKSLADHGATVIRVESTLHPDSVRLGGPFKDGIPGVNRSGFFADFNTSKKSIAIDLKSERGRAIAHELADWADVVTESYTPGVMSRHGLAYEDLRKTNPGLVMLSTCMQGQTGPHAHYAGYGGQGAALAGFHYVTGWPDLDPAGPKGAYTDAITPRFGLVALVAAVTHARRTGIGQYVDLSQIEVGLQLLAPEIIDYQLTGHVAGPMGNRSEIACPHGAFPCDGDDRWVSIAVETDEQWQALAEVIGGGASGREEFATFDGRLRAVDEVEDAVAEWTRSRDRYEVMHRLQRAGVPCGVVQRPSDLFHDPQLAHRGHFWALDHPEIGPLRYNGASFSLSETPAYPRSAAPLLGAHTREVLTQVLGYSESEVDQLGYEQVLQ